MTHTPVRARQNPFRVERALTVRYRPLETDWDALLVRLRELNFRAAICGTEGSGKTTLLEDLAKRLGSSGRTTCWLQLRRETRAVGHRLLRDYLETVTSEDVLLGDGVEQLGPLSWRRLRSRSRRCAGLIITTHTPGRLPTLIECRTTVPLLESIVEQLVPDDLHELRDELPALFARCDGNIRLCLRELYDRYARIQ